MLMCREEPGTKFQALLLHNLAWLKRAPKDSWFRLKLLTKQSKFGIIRLLTLML